ncbi:MAG: hypothetical protein SPLUMA2_SPLUMAMAG2_00284 [uncultured Sulfurimonas sp.]|jgi:hypothetical protein|nr:MAG: hypothetical protein SPLUMA1_SPLUMAMAG1_00218 [uncultured Sulfurimonas sp.]CAI6152698.1 MAG: hypothetical protein SPLUMA2_SPLUMAMAG2_00284 [uncultured Sulfurimonas sp.]
MKLFLLTIMIVLGLVSCASQSDDAYYDRANKANDKAQADLNK